MYWVYILKSCVKSVTYTGSTNDLDRRLKEHNSGKSTFTRRYVPWVVVYKEELKSISEAREREKYLKSRAVRNWIKDNSIIPR